MLMDNEIIYELYLRDVSLNQSDNTEDCDNNMLGIVFLFLYFHDFIRSTTSVVLQLSSVVWILQCITV